MRLADIIRILEELAPPEFAMQDDRIGLQIGDPGADIRGIVVALDVSAAVVGEVIRRKADLLITHHALFWTPLRSIRLDVYPQSLIYQLVNAGVGLYVMHTNWDAAPGGINDVLADRLDIIDTKILEPTHTRKLFKVVTFVPDEAVDTVRDAMADAGAGVIGDYTDCSFQTPGTGTFTPLHGAQPYTGDVGELKEVAEFRLEMIAPEDVLHGAISAMIEAHPYEEVAYDVYPLWNKGEEFGLGRYGRLRTPTTFGAFCAMACEALGVKEPRTSGDPGARVETVAILGGGGGQYVTLAHAKGVDAFVTGDVKHHEFLEAKALGLNVLDATHFWTERPGMIALAPKLHALLSDSGVTVEYVDDVTLGGG